MKDKDIRRLAVMGLFGAISIALVYFIHLPILPAAPFLEYDPANIPILLGAFLYGTVPGLLLTVVVSVVQGLTVSASSGPIGILMHIVATGSYVLASTLLWQRLREKRFGLVISLVAGVLTMTASMALWNYLITPLYMGIPRSAVAGMLLPVFIPFNLIKGSINALVTGLLVPRLKNQGLFRQ